MTKVPKNLPSVHERLLNEYREKYDLYADFSTKIASILEQVLKDNNYRSQLISHRAKNPSSAKEQLIKRECENLQDLKDLSGCRVIFYLENDIETFVHNVYETFGEKNVVDHDNKISNDGYNAIHLVIELGKDRLVHPEYKRYAGLRCEIQITTVLHHAWSEMEHDLIYKPQKELTEFDKKSFEALREAFEKTMADHIIPATRDFGHIFREYEKLQGGKSVFNVMFLKKIEKALSLNAVQEDLKLLLQYVQEFGDKTPKELNLVDLLEKVLVRSRVLKPKAIKTTFGQLPGARRQDIILQVLEILYILRYLHTEATCGICFNLIKTERDPKIVNKATDILKNICKYDLRILKTGGYHPQKIALDFLKKTGELNKGKTIPTITLMLEEVLSPSFHGVSGSTYNSITFQPTTLSPTKGLKSLRKQAIESAKVLYGTARNITNKKAVLQVFEHALRASDYPVKEQADELDKMLTRDTKSVLTFYSSLLNEENEVIQEIESHLMFLHRHTGRVTRQLKQLIKIIGENVEYETFKVFVGYDVGFYPNLDFEKAENYRSEKIKEYIEDITKSTIPKWKKTFRKVTKNYKEAKPGLFTYFNKFLFELGKQKPDIALSLISEKSLEPFLIHLISGVWMSAKKSSAKAIISKWVTQSRYLAVSATVFDYVEEIDQKLFKQITAKAIQKKDVKALNALIASTGRNYIGQLFIRTAFIQIVKTLTTLKNNFWVNSIWFRKNSIAKDLTRAQYKVVLENLLVADLLSWHIEEILEPLVEKYPKDFVNFLLDRVEYSKRFKGRGLYPSSRYDAIPHSFDKLGETLRKSSKIIIPEVLQWFSMGEPKKDRWLYQWEATHFLKDIFPGSDPLLQKELIKMIKKGDKEGETVIHSFIARFEGEDFLWDLVEEVVKSYKKASSYTDIKRNLFGYLSQTGVVSGEYGFVEAYTQKKENLTKLKHKKSKDFVIFINEYETYLEKLIVSEKKRADDDIDRRKREYSS